MKTKFESIQKIRDDGYPKVKEISNTSEIFKTDPKDANFGEPLSKLNKEYK